MAGVLSCDNVTVKLREGTDQGKETGVQQWESRTCLETGEGTSPSSSLWVREGAKKRHHLVHRNIKDEASIDGGHQRESLDRTVAWSHPGLHAGLKSAALVPGL